MTVNTVIPLSNNGSGPIAGATPNLPAVNTAAAYPTIPPPSTGTGLSVPQIPVAPLPGVSGAGSYAI